MIGNNCVILFVSTSLNSPPPQQSDIDNYVEWPCISVLIRGPAMQNNKQKDGGICLIQSASASRRRSGAILSCSAVLKHSVVTQPPHSRNSQCLSPPSEVRCDTTFFTGWKVSPIWGKVFKFSTRLGKCSFYLCFRAKWLKRRKKSSSFQNIRNQNQRTKY